MKHTEIKLEDDEDEPELSEVGGVCSFWSGLMLGSNVSQVSRHQVSRDSQQREELFRTGKYKNSVVVFK